MKKRETINKKEFDVSVDASGYITVLAKDEEDAIEQVRKMSHRDICYHFVNNIEIGMDVEEA